MQALIALTCCILGITTTLLGLTNMQQTWRIEALEARVEQITP